MSRVEDAGLNASAPPQQRWLDGWIVRYLPGKARRARCINAVAAGRLALDDKLAMAAEVYRVAELPMIFRLTRFTQPETLDTELADRGYTLVDSTRVMVLSALPSGPARSLPAGCHLSTLNGPDFAEATQPAPDSAPPDPAPHPPTPDRPIPARPTRPPPQRTPAPHPPAGQSPSGRSGG